MAELMRIRNELSWGNGSPGVCTYYVSKGLNVGEDWQSLAPQATAEINEAWLANAGRLPTTLTWRFLEEFDVIDVESGQIIDQFSDPNAAENGVGGNASNTGSRAMQMYFRFQTDQFRNGRRLAGGTYMGPCSPAIYGSVGEMDLASAADAEGAWAAIISGVGPRLAVYHRPAKGAVSGGFYGDVTNIRVKRRGGILRSRRD
jgi:hypothetical protein